MRHKSLAILLCLIIIYRYKYRRQLNPDGNFTAQHMKMQRPDLDVGLTDGEGYQVKEAPYEEHLLASKDVKEVRIQLNILIYVLNGTLLLRNVPAIITKQFRKPTQVRRITMQLGWGFVRVLGMVVLSLILQ